MPPPESKPRRLALLGPQREERTVPDVVASFGLAGAEVATVTAGWEERERDDADLDRDLGGRTRNLELFPRAEEVFQRDPDLRRAMYHRYDRMNEQVATHRAQLSPLLASLAELEARVAAGEAHLAPDLAHAVSLVQSLDEHRLRRVDEIDAAVFEDLRPWERGDIAKHREQLRKLLDGVGALLVAGGHVGILLNRLRLFGVLELAAGLPVIAWAGGAMVFTERIVLFHDSPPHGSGDPEVHVRGLGLARGCVVFPDAEHRLDLAAPLRAASLARRFAPALCLTLDKGSRLAGDEARPVAEWEAATRVRVLTQEGAKAFRGTPREAARLAR